MALLHSLQICGIRSFSPEGHQTISFNTPVTLFLGQNGCGKTTILESIRYALTGEIPSGTNSGQGFINDPKMTKKGQIKASIKIKFLDSQGNMITVSRFMSVTSSNKSAGGLTFKRLMPNIRRRDKDNPQDEPEDISGRCVDIDSFCCTSLNVSKSILNNVLFCHQENSAWPLDEPKKLKEKFDEIFDAVKYNKCVEVVRKMIKEKSANIKVLKERLEHKKTIKQEVERQMAKLATKKDDLQGILDEISEREKQIVPLDQRLREIVDLEDTLGSLQRELHQKQAEMKGLLEQQSSIEKNISDLFEGSDEELQNKMLNFNSQQEVEKKAISEMEKNKEEIVAKITKINVNIQGTQVKIGQFKEEQKQHLNKIKKFNEDIDTLRSQLQLDEFDDINDRKSIINTLKQTLVTLDDNYNSLVKEKDAQERELQNNIDTLREQHAMTKQQFSSKTKTTVDIQKELKKINNDLNELDASDSQLKIVGKTIEDYENTLAKLKNSFDEAEKAQEIEELKETVLSKERDLEKLEKEYRILQQNYAKEQQLETERNSLLEKQREISRIMNKHSDNLKKLFGENIPERKLKNAIVDIQNREEIKVKSLTQKISKIEKEMTTVETNISHFKKKLESDKKDLATKQKKVAQMCEGRDFNQVLEECRQRKDKLQKDKGEYSSGKIMYEAFIRKFKVEAPCCPICETDFRSKGAIVQNIIEKLEKKIERIPTLLKQTESSLKKEEELFIKLQRLKDVNDDVDLLKNTKIPAMEDELQSFNDKYEESQMNLAGERMNLTNPQELVDVSKSVLTDAALLDQYQTDITKINVTIANLERNIVTVSSKRSRQETEAEIDFIKADLSNIKSRLESNKKMVDQHKDRCHRLNMNIQNEIQKQIDMQKLVQKKPLLEIQQRELNEKLGKLREEIEELSDAVETQGVELKKAVAMKQEADQANRKIKDKERSRINMLTNSLKDIQKLHQDIEDYITNNTDRKLDDSLEELAKYNLRLEQMEETKNKIVDAISNKKESLAKKESEYRALKDNVLLREKKKAEEKLQTEIEDMKRNVGGYNYRSLYEEKQKIERDISKFNREINSHKGKKEEIESQVEDLETELAKPQNRHAVNNFNKQFYELSVENSMVTDLTEYIKVLEKSVLKFHEERMVQINKTVRELWRTIYRGNDIDYIEIKTDEVTGGNRKRSYNYKVVQVKNHVELEMRGRCSAGQKVLACLVIRLALAETFSSHCGILALDEPTTNLDRENIQSLSDALSKIITDRDRLKNFQLLVITHDEDFLNTLSSVQSLESYWRVQRNSLGFSTVEKKML